MKTRISILFYAKKAKSTPEGATPIYLRVTIDGKRIEATTKRYIDCNKWSPASGRMKGNSEEARSVNTYLDMLQNQVYDYQTELIQKGLEVNLDNMKNKIHGVKGTNRFLIPIFEDHNKRIQALVGQEYAPGTIKRYETSLRHTQNFLKWKYNISDIEINKIDHAFITDYEFYLRTIRKCNNNSAVKYIKNFGKVIRICLDNDWLDKNPFAKYKMKVKQVDRVFLTKEEIETMSEKVFANERLNQVKDIFLFSCFTGLAYADVKKLDSNQVSIGIDGERWIFTNRQKTDTRANIPLLPMAEQVLDKYSDNPECKNKNRLLPILSNQKMNAYLKEIADLCGINKPLTYHIARHTFATTVTLSNGVPIESVSKMLGHKDLKTTQHYAKILDSKVSNDMMLLKAKLTPQLKIVSDTKTGSN